MRTYVKLLLLQSLHRCHSFLSSTKHSPTLYQTPNKITTISALNINLGWHQSRDYEDGMKVLDHEEVTYRPRSGEVLQSFIPQQERYSTRDWLHNLKTIRTSRLLKRIFRVIMFNTIWSMAVSILHCFTKFTTPGMTMHALLGSALGLLLVFRTNTAYDRYWEGRKIWERLLSTLRDIGRMTAIYSDSMQSSQMLRIVHLLCAFPVVLQEHTQGFCKPEKLKGLLTTQEIRLINQMTNRPFYVINLLSKEIRLIPDSVSFTPRERQAMFKYVDDMSRSIGCCERIVQTPVPLTYARHTSRFLSLWTLALPLCAVGELGWLVIPFTSFVTWALFGIQEIGMTIEEPFQRSLKLEVFANTIRRDLSDMLHVSNVRLNPSPIESNALSYEPPAYYRAGLSMDHLLNKYNFQGESSNSTIVDL